MPRDSTASRARILAAAIDEFADHGLAGARVDRIAARAECNKQLIYEYYGNKEGVFDAAIDSTTALLDVAAPFDPNDLPGFAVALFDVMVEHPRLARLVRWHALERPGVAGALPSLMRTNQSHVRAVRAAQREGTVSDRLPARLLMVFILRLVQTNEDERLVNRGKPLPQKLKREALRAAVEQLCAPTPR
ncbi:MAG: transcriptional regulator, TetR family [Ilumatobacteraceae bacterium]|nr:transcriptional regulator, TetR family [Ilumatobacteraceae bacterium]